MPKIPKRYLVPMLEFPGEPNDQAWTTVVPRSMSLAMREVQSEWNLPSKNRTLRELVAFALYQLASANEEFLDPKGRAIARLRAAVARAEAQAHKTILNKVNELLIMAAETSDATVEKSLKRAAEDLAEVYGLPWPPPKPSVIDGDPVARPVLERILSLLDGEQKGKITFRILSRSLNRSKEVLLPVVMKLAEEKFIQTYKGGAKGKNETLWILGPPLAS